MAPTIGPVLPGALKALCSLLGWSWGDFARALGLSRNTLHRIEKGVSKLSDKKQEAAKSILEITPEEFEAAVHLATLIFERKNAGIAPPAPGSRRARLAKQFEAAVRDARAFLESRVRAIEVAEAKEEAERLWKELATRPQKERLVRVETCDEFLAPAFIARLCDESENAAARKASEAVELADLALKVAELAPGTERQRAGRLGYSWGFVGNARRVSNAPGAADLAFASSCELWSQGAGEEPEFFDPARLLDREASLRRDQGRFTEALELLDQALTVSGPVLRTRLLLNQAATLEQEGEPEKALAVLGEARPAIERGEGGPRFRWILLFNVVKCLVHLERGSEAETRLPDVRSLATEIGNDLDRLRTRALGGEVLSLTGHPATALAELEAVRLEFTALGLPVDSAVVGLDEAAILLGEGRNAEVRALTHQMRPTFAALRLERESLAAVRLFLEAVERDAATVAMAREAARYICRLPRRAWDPATRAALHS
ncbi:MAG TPA: helix-turn-helix transcriptional regulator [Thermoanaerobaculia bacterium]|jgi:transcriptional regulator with XRE-family HTH domain|nr:helix-turn-helix transcriptional regulator [Thermoanaerobaculia bacterium]